MHQPPDIVALAMVTDMLRNHDCGPLDAYLRLAAAIDAEGIDVTREGMERIRDVVAQYSDH